MPVLPRFDTRRLVSLILSLAVAITGALAFVTVSSPMATAAPPTATPTTLMNETFGSGIVGSWKRYGTDAASECLTNSAGTAIPRCSDKTPIASNGALRLSDARFVATGQVFANQRISPDAGLVINFDLNQYGPAGAGTQWSPAYSGAGTVLVLAATDPDAPAAPTRRGLMGVDLGYAGIDKTYMGFASDITGYFPGVRSGIYDSCATGSGYGGQGVPVTVDQSSISARGPGDFNGSAYTGYCYLGARETESGAADFNHRWSPSTLNDPSSLVPLPTPVEVVLNPSANPIDMPKGYTVPAYGFGMWQKSYYGGQPVRVITGLLPRGTVAARGVLAGGNYPASWINDRTGMPKALTLGFVGSSSSGQGVDRFGMKEISDLTVKTLVNAQSSYSLSLGDSNGGQLITGDAGSVFTVTPTLSGNPDQNSPTITTTFPIGVTPPAWSNFATGNGYTCTRGATSPYTVTCTYAPVAPQAWPIAAGALPTLSIPVDGTAGTYPVSVKLTSPSADFAGVTASRTITLSYPALQLSAPSVPYGSTVVATVPNLPTNARGSIVYVARPAGTTGASDIDLCTKTLPTTGTEGTMADTRCDITQALPVGDYTIRAIWDDGSVAPFNAHTYTQPLTITRATTSLSAATSSSSTSYGSPVSILTTMSPIAADGTVMTVMSGTTKVCDDIVLPTTSCTSYASLPPGTYPVTVSFAGDTNTKPATASTSFTVTKADTALNAAADPTTIEAGSTSTLSVGGMAPDATGTVTFKEGNVTLCTVTHATANPDNVWACTTDPSLSKGIHTIVASYSGDANYRAVNSSFFALNVTAQSVGFPISGSPATVEYGTRATLTISGLPSDATGSVTFMDGGRVLCEIGNVAPSAGSTTMRTSCQTATDLPVGVYDNVVAKYSGNDKYLASSSDPFTVTVTKATPTLGTAAAPVSVVYGSPVTVSATGVPTDASGTLTFTSGGQTLCVATLPAISCNVTKTLAAGSYPVSVAYSGAGNYNPATGSGASFTVTLTGASFAAAASPAGVAYGSDVVLSVSGLPANPTGTVVFTSGGTTLCSVDVSTSSACSVTKPDAGTYPVTATWTQAGQTTTAQTTFTVTKQPTVLVASAPSSVAYGNQVSFGVSGLPAGATGAVTFKDEAGATLCTATLPATSCTTTTAPAVGSHQVTATWGGDTNHAGDTSEAVTFTVTKVASSLNVALNPATIAYGTSSTLIANGLPASATGSVTFTAGGATLCEVTLPASPIACATANDLAPGTYNVVASYSGDGNLKAASSSAVVLKVTKKTLGSALTATATNTTYGSPSTLSASLPADATGTVTFTSGGKVMCTYDAATETSCVTASDLPAGTYAVSATYSGDGSYSAGSASTSFTVSKAPASASGLTGTATPATIAQGQQSELAVAGLVAGATGTVVFKDANNTVLCSIADVTVTRSCLTDKALAQGTYTIKAFYSGDAGHVAATSASFTLVVNSGPVPVAMTLTVTPATVAYGDTAALSVSGLSAGATGRVDFKDGSTLLCSAMLPATSCATSPALVVGSYSVTAFYTGDAAYAPGQSGAQPLKVTKAPVTLASYANPSSVGVSTAATVGATGLPAGATGSLSFTTGSTALCSATLPATSCAVAANLATSATPYPVTVTYSGDANVASGTGSGGQITVTGNPAPTTLGLSAAPATVTFGNAVNLAVSGVPAGATGAVDIVKQGTSTVLCTINDITTSHSCLTSAALAPGAYTAAVAIGAESATAAFTVTQAGSNITGTASPTTVVRGTPVTLTVGGIPAGATGTVTFRDGADNVLCTVALAGGRSCEAPANLAVGHYDVTARWPGDADHAGSTSAVFGFDIEKTPTTPVLGIAPATVAYGSVSTLSVSGLDGATGVVRFIEGSTVLCQVTLPGATSCTTAATLAVGAHTVRADYAGDSSHGSSLSAPKTLTVTKATATLASYANPASVGASTAATVGATGVPTAATGTLVFSTGATTLCSANLPATSCVVSANLPTSATAYPVTVSYSGDANVEAATGTGGSLTVTGNPPPSVLTLTAAPSTATYGTAVNLALQGIPSGATGAVDIVKKGTSQVLCTIADISVATSCMTAPDLAPGTYTAKVTIGTQTSEAAFTVTQAGSSLTGAANPNQIVVGNSSTLSIGGVPAGATGAVQFKSGANVLCSIADVATATSCQTATSLPIGSYSVVATWAGDAGHQGGSSAPFTLIVVKASSVSGFAVAAVPDSVVFGTSTQLTVSGLPDNATGTVSFSAGGRTLCHLTLPGTQCATDATLKAGTYDVQAVYSGDDRHDSAIATTTFQVTKRATSVAGAVAPATVLQGESGVFTVSGLPTAATGAVTFTGVAGGTAVVLCTIGDVAATSACTSSRTLPAGTYTVTAEYAGDTGHQGSTSDPFTFTVNPSPATAGFTIAATPSSASYGTPLTLSVANMPTPATGQVDFLDGTRLLCSVQLPATSCVTSTAMPVGSYQVYANYSGDGSFLTGVAGPVTVTVVKAKPDLALYVNPGTVSAGTAAEVGVTGLPAIASGTIQFSSGSTVLCTAELPATSCATANSLVAGAYPVTARYSGDSGHESADGSGKTLTVTAPTPVSTLAASAAPTSVPFGTPASLAVSGLAPGSTGPAVFKTGGTVLCTIPDVATSSACSTSATLEPGTYDVTVTFGGMTAGTTFTVTKAASAVTGAAAPAAVTYGSAATLSVGGIPADATGTVRFLNGSEVVCQVTLPTRSCSTTPHMGAAVYSLVASYSGDGHYSGAASSPFSFTVVKSSFKIKGGTKTVAVKRGKKVTFFVRGIPAGVTGKVSVRVGGRPTCVMTLPKKTCTARVKNIPGLRAVRVIYHGNANYNPARAWDTLRVKRR